MPASDGRNGNKTILITVLVALLSAASGALIVFLVAFSSVRAESAQACEKADGAERAVQELKVDQGGRIQDISNKVDYLYRRAIEERRGN